MVSDYNVQDDENNANAIYTRNSSVNRDGTT